MLVIFLSSVRLILLLFTGYRHLELSNRIYAFLNEVRQCCRRREKKDKFRQIISVIMRSPQNYPDVESIARVFCVPASTLFRMFQSRLGCSPMKFVIYHRLVDSCWQLVSREIPVNAVAEMYGYTNAAFYIREFKKIPGITPLQYRKAFQGEENAISEEAFPEKTDSKRLFSSVFVSQAAWRREFSLMRDARGATGLVFPWTIFPCLTNICADCGLHRC